MSPFRHRILRSLIRRVRGWPDLARLEANGLRLGKNVFIGGGAWLDPDFCFLIRIDDDAVLSINVTILVHDASTRMHLGYSRVAPVHVGRRAFVGAGSILLPGVTIGEESIVGAGSVVRADVAPRTVVAGNPARTISSLDAYLSRQSEALGKSPCWPRAGSTTATGITPGRRAEILAALEHGEVFIT